MTLYYIQLCQKYKHSNFFMWNNHHTKFHRNLMNKESGVRDGPLFFGGGAIVISRRKESFLHHRYSTCKFFLHSSCADNFLKIPQILNNIPGGLCRHFFQMHLWDRQFFQFFSFLMQTIFFPITIPPGENNSLSLMLADPPRPS